MEKKVIISESLYSKLMYDMEVFKFDGSNNDFYSTVIINTFEFEDTHKKLEQYTKLLSGKTNKLKDNDLIASIRDLENISYYQKQLTDIAIEIEKIHDSEVFSSGATKEIFVRETAKTKGQLSAIIEESLGNTAAVTFKNILSKYVSYPMYIRERIIFPNTYLILEESIKRKTKCKLTTKKNKSFIIEPYKLIPGKDEYHYYLTCYGTFKDNNERKPMAFKLSSIQNIAKIYESYSLIDVEINELQERITILGPEYINGEQTEFKVQFDKYGVHLYDVLYKDRPYCIKKENGEQTIYNGEVQTYQIYTFASSEFQMENYLKVFGYHAKVLDNDKLNTKLKEFHQKALKAFE